MTENDDDDDNNNNNNNNNKVFFHSSTLSTSFTFIEVCYLTSVLWSDLFPDSWIFWDLYVQHQ